MSNIVVFCIAYLKALCHLSTHSPSPHCLEFHLCVDSTSNANQVLAARLCKIFQLLNGRIIRYLQSQKASDSVPENGMLYGLVSLISLRALEKFECISIKYATIADLAQLLQEPLRLLSDNYWTSIQRKQHKQCICIAKASKLLMVHRCKHFWQSLLFLYNQKCTWATKSPSSRS